jgi:hypothetical protein
MSKSVNREVTIRVVREGEVMRSFKLPYTEAILFRMMWEKAHVDDSATIEIE